MIKKIIDKLAYPFKYDIVFFIILWVIVSLPNCYSQIEEPVYAIYLAMMYYVITYVMVMTIDLNNIIARLIKPLLLVFAAFVTMLNLYCYKEYNCLLSYDFMQIIAGTNWTEVKEYFDTYLSVWHCVLFLSILVLCFVVTMAIQKRIHKRPAYVCVTASLFLGISIAAMSHNSGMLKEEFSNKIVWKFRFDEVVDLRKHLTHPVIVETDSVHPDQIVIIIGESFSRNHSSLYGYEKKTNPLLEIKEKKGNLIVFSNVTAPLTNTTAVFKYILNTAIYGKDDGKTWYEHTNIIEVLNEAGYHTFWISNQLEKGLFDNLPSSHSMICNKSIFINETNGLDANLIKATPKSTGKCAFFYHLMGQHVDFKSRYPAKYDHFNAKQYMTYKEHQRDVIANYDNATLYNDFVVNSIMDLYKDRNAVVIYFADHGLDLFDTDPNFFGHAKMTVPSKAHARQIPFMIYLTPFFIEKNRKKVERIKRSFDLPFCTDRLIYAIMDIAGYRFSDNDNVSKFTFGNDLLLN